MLEPLHFTPSSENKIPESGSDAQNVVLPCLLCEAEFPASGANLADYHGHLREHHDLVISDVKLVCDMPRYIKYWKERFLSELYTNICKITTSKANEICEGRSLQSSLLYTLGASIPEDKQLRQQLQSDRLKWILECQQKERESKTFHRGCLFCRETFTGNRAELLEHMSTDHNFSIGRADNIVFINELLDLLEDKLTRLQCFYCEKTFKDKPTLKEHMRKKLHKKINPSNTSYDRFYVINYLEIGKNWETVQAEDDREIILTDREEQQEWGDWEGDGCGAAVCLFCDVTSTDVHQLLSHMQNEHSFNLTKMKEDHRLTFYDQVKLVNYVRKQVYELRCISCEEQVSSRTELLHHLQESGHLKEIPLKAQWDQPQYYFPTYEDDSLLYVLEDDDDVSNPSVVPENIDVADIQQLASQLRSLQN